MLPESPPSVFHRGVWRFWVIRFILLGMKKGLGTLRRFVAIAALFLAPFAVALAQSPKLANPIKFATLEEFLLAIVKVVVQYGAILVVFFLVYAGFLFVTAQGSDEKIVQAKKTFVWVVIGAFVLLGVYVLRAAICGTLNQLKNSSAPNFCEETTPPSAVGGGTQPLPVTGGATQPIPQAAKPPG